MDTACGPEAKRVIDQAANVIKPRLFIRQVEAKHAQANLAPMFTPTI